MVPAGLACSSRFLAFSGFESSAILGEESHNPRRTVPRAILFATIPSESSTSSVATRGSLAGGSIKSRRTPTTQTPGARWQHACGDLSHSSPF
jgi:hypothetical protein